MKSTSKISTRARFMQILRILRKYQIRKGMDPVKFRRILEDLGPTFVKIGQIMSTRQDMFSERYCKELMKLRSRVTPMSFDTVKEQIEKSYHKPMSEVFSSFEPIPLGSASIAQVHEATLRDGTRVVAKVQRPYIYEWMERDVGLLRKAIRILNLSDIVSSVVDLNMVIDEFWTAAKQEMDFTNEAAFAKRFRKTYEDCNFIDAPQIIDAFTTKEVLVMEYIDGYEINDVHTLEKEGYDVKEIADKLAYNYISQIIEHGFFHADPHSGNIRIRQDKIVWIDFGMMGILENRDRQIMKQAIRALALGDVANVVDSILAIGIVQKEIDYIAFTNAIESFMAQYMGESFADMDLAKMVQDIFTICHQFRIGLPKGISMLARSMMTMNGTLINLDPTTSMAKIVSQHKATLTQIDPSKEIQKTIKRSIEGLSRSLDLPVQTSDVLKLIQHGQIKVNLNLMGSDAPIAKIDRMVNRLIVCILIAALLVGSCLICTTDMEPHIMGIPAIGFFMLLIALVMSIWLFIKMFFLHRKNKAF